MSRVERSMSIVYGGPPFGWNTSQRIAEIEQMLYTFPRINDRILPLTTYLLYAKSQLRFDLSTQFTAVFSENMKNKFIEHLRELSEKAKVQVSLDAGNFKAEVAAFGDMEVAIKSPHLDVSPVYRYAAAVQQGLLAYIDDTLIADAVAVLRVNPYLFFAYGKDYVPLMPIAWEDL